MREDKQEGNLRRALFAMSTDSITVIPVCEEWQKCHSNQLNLDFVRSNGIKHGSGTFNIAINQSLKTCRITPDGNCLFRSFSQILTGTQENHDLLRATTVSFMMANASLFENVCSSVEEHISTSKMAQLGNWGTEVEIFAMATILNCRIYVYSKCGNDNQWLEYKPLKTDTEDIHTDEVVMISNLSHHFEPVSF